MAPRKVCVVTGARSEYYLLRPVMEAIKRSAGLRLQTVVTGSHLLPEFGSTVNEIELDGFSVDSRVDMVMAGDTLKAMAKSIGVGVIGLADAIDALAPDVVLLLGDRYEMLSAAIAAAYSGRVVAHIHGGDSPQGGFDEYSRHAITKMSHIHLVATEMSARRVRQLGEDERHIFVVGSPAIDAILRDAPTRWAELEQRYGIPRGKDFLLVVQHSVSTSPDTASAEIVMTLEALAGTGMPMVGVFPNVDPGGAEMRKRLTSMANGLQMHLFTNVPHADYLGLMRSCAAMVGNSSSGIIEGPTFKVPVVNIGDRQSGRERAPNVIDVPQDRAAIEGGVRRALDPAFRDGLGSMVSPYGDGRSAERVVRILEQVELGRQLLRKRFHDLACD